MKCKICKKESEFECCSVEHAIMYVEKKKKIEWNKRKAEMKESLESKSELMNRVQKDFNTFIRYRDVGKDCISCDTILTMSNMNAGHFYDTKVELLRFDELNVHGQCIQCNKHFHGNLIKYRIKLEKRIGTYFLHRLDNQSDSKFRFSKLEIKRIHENIKKELKIIKK
jgi:hypothetical protein